MIIHVHISTVRSVTIYLRANSDNHLSGRSSIPLLKTCIPSLLLSFPFLSPLPHSPADSYFHHIINPTVSPSFATFSSLISKS